jgi:hypothetical protein
VGRWSPNFWTSFSNILTGAGVHGQSLWAALGITNLAGAIGNFLWNTIADIVRPHDPNDKIGPGGSGDVHYVSASMPLAYTIDFENASTAMASARTVSITDPLDPNIDPRTLTLGEIGFGSRVITVPAGRSFYSTIIDLGTSPDLLLQIEAGIDPTTGVATWAITSIDPTTGQPSANLGFLPPDDANHDGEGFVTYTVKPRAGLPTGTVITNQASIVFDTEAPIPTNQTSNTLDAVAPTSAVAALPATLAATSIPVTWSGVDDPGGSGLSGYDIFVSVDGGPAVAWLRNTTLTSATYAGAIGHSYAFSSIAYDNAGNFEAMHATPDAMTTLVNPAVPTPPVGLAITPDTGPTPGDGITNTGAVVLSGTLNLANLAVDVFDTSTGTDLGDAAVSGTGFITAVLNLAEGAHHLRVRASDGQGNLADSFFDVLVDLTGPTSQVNALPATATSYSLPITVTGSDPGTLPSGVVSYAVFVAIDNGSFSTTPWAIVPASDPTATYTAEGSHHYYFRSVATDAAGNVESKPVSIEAGTFVPDLTPPVTTVTTATPNDSNDLFTINVSGTDTGGSGLATFEVFVQVDNTPVQQVASAAAGILDGNGLSTARRPTRPPPTASRTPTASSARELTAQATWSPTTPRPAISW